MVLITTIHLFFFYNFIYITNLTQKTFIVDQNINPKLAPFSCKFSTNIPELLQELKCTIAISTYQAGKLIFISAKNKERLIQLPRSFEKAMGVAIEGSKMAIACKDEVILLQNSPQLAEFYPKNPKVYDAMYMPRVTYHTGAIDVHDLDFCETGLCAVNTNFSCIISINENYSFTPIWKPDFVSSIRAGDVCHLNGMAVDNSKIKYVTAFAQTDEPRAWTSTVAKSGILIDYETKEIIAHGLGMPHSPRIHNGVLYMLLSATGEFIKLDSHTGQKTVIRKIDGFVRGLAFKDDFAFIGISKIRKNSSSFGHLDIADKANNAGVVIVHLGTGAQMGHITYNASVDEIYDVQILSDITRPSILNTIKDDYKLGISIPDKTFWAKKIEKKK